MEKVLFLDGISKKFGDVYALRDINLEAMRGEVFGLLGPSGAGKTTMMRLLTGQLRPDGGSASVFGCPCDKITNDIYRHIGMVMDNSGIYKRLTVLDNMILFADIYGVSRDSILPLLQRVGLDAAVKKPAEKLSKGMQQRLILARSVLHKPTLLFLDEPTSGLDPATARSMHEMLLDLQKEGTTIFLTTHNMDEAYKLCDNIALLNNGEIVEYGNPEALCRKYNTERKLRLLLRNGENVELGAGKESADAVKQYMLDDVIETMHSSEPDLEDVFLLLTGRALA